MRLLLLLLILSPVASIRPAFAIDQVANSTAAEGGFRDFSNCPEMIVVPPGEFLMGTTVVATSKILESMPAGATGVDKDSLNREHPEHLVKIGRRFALGKYIL
jgi:formylglycine-generating enzyme required for sulfatase activity